MADPLMIGKYQTQRLVKRGGMGALYLAYDPELERQVAIKVIRDDIEAPQLRERFAREAKAVARLRHPNIVTIFDYGVQRDLEYIVMEYIPGETLAEVIRRLPPCCDRFKLQLIEGICNGLAFAHKANIVHRDVKPANVMVDVDGTVKILDFGIAWMAGSNLTRTGDFFGTLNYMAPEQMTGATVDHRTDIFAVGAVLYELVTGLKAFPGDVPETVIAKILYEAPTPVATLCPGIDQQLSAIIDKALAKNPAERYENLGLLQLDLSAVRERVHEGRKNATLTQRLVAKAVRTFLASQSNSTDATTVSVPQETLSTIRRRRPKRAMIRAVLVTIGLLSPTSHHDASGARPLASRRVLDVPVQLPAALVDTRPSFASTPEPVIAIPSEKAAETAKPQPPRPREIPPVKERGRTIEARGRATEERRPASNTLGSNTIEGPRAERPRNDAVPPTLASVNGARAFPPHAPATQPNELRNVPVVVESAAVEPVEPVPVRKVDDGRTAERQIRRTLDQYLNAMSSLSVDGVRAVQQLNESDAEKLRKSLAGTRALKIELIGEPTIQVGPKEATARCALKYSIQRNVGSLVTTNRTTTFTFDRVGERWMIDSVIP
jgi:serine/threonine protein kinase